MSNHAKKKKKPAPIPTGNSREYTKRHRSTDHDETISRDMPEYRSDWFAPFDQWRKHTVDCGSILPELDEYITYPPLATYYRPIYHKKFTSQLGGGPLGIGPAFYHYIALSTDSEFIWTPTRHVLQGAISLFPDLAYLPNMEEGVWRGRYDGVNSAIKQVRPSLNSGFSLVNFLLQYKDIIHIYTHWLSSKGRVKRFAEFMQQAKHSPSAALRATANEWLELQYGTLQFFRDAYTIYRIFRDWKQNADKFIKGANQWHGKTAFGGNAKLSGLPFNVRTAPFDLFGTSSVGASYLQTYEVLTLETKVTLVYSYGLPELSGLLARVFQLSDSFGVSLDPSIVWDAIPFSFVVDWFFNVGEWLHAQRRDLYKADVTYHQFGNSAKFSIDRNVDFIHTSIPIFGEGQGTQRRDSVWTDSYVRYERVLKELPQFAMPLPENNQHWSFTRIANATALFVQKAVRGHRVLPVQKH
jgi:hypothetical protein